MLSISEVPELPATLEKKKKMYKTFVSLGRNMLPKMLLILLLRFRHEASQIYLVQRRKTIEEIDSENASLNNSLLLSLCLTDRPSSLLKHRSPRRREPARERAWVWRLALHPSPPGSLPFDQLCSGRTNSSWPFLDERKKKDNRKVSLSCSADHLFHPPRHHLRKMQKVRNLFAAIFVFLNFN